MKDTMVEGKKKEHGKKDGKAHRKWTAEGREERK